MKMTKSLALMAMGVGMTLAYQKYSKPLMKSMSREIDKTASKMDKKLDEMI